ncbi:MAG: hypothetical protein IJO02_09735, partial [Clostridia bacterium]|nr:hypothetical protein [Clostridia bacterium]
MKGFASARCEFLFPDTALGSMPESLSAACAKNGRVGVQLLFACSAPCASLEISADGFRAERFQLLSVPVEYNTGDGVNQGGAMVILPDEKP